MSTKRKAEDQEEVTKKAKKVEEVVAEEEVNKIKINFGCNIFYVIGNLSPFFFQFLVFTIIFIIFKSKYLWDKSANVNIFFGLFATLSCVQIGKSFDDKYVGI